jgi:hypothetical protein
MEILKSVARALRDASELGEKLDLVFAARGVNGTLMGIPAAGAVPRQPPALLATPSSARATR